MKIDLHLHSLASVQNGDSIKWDSTYNVIKRIFNAGVKLASFTDHNVFDYKLFKEASLLAKTGGLIFLPGIEVNVVRKNGIIAHMLILFSENLNDDQLLKLSLIAKQNIRKNGVSIAKINDLFSEFETIRIIHIGKSEFFAYEDLDGLNYDAFEVTNFNHPNYLSIIKRGAISSIVSFSDTHIWDDYPQINNLITEIADLKEPTFVLLKKALAKNQIYSKEKI